MTETQLLFNNVLILNNPRSNPDVDFIRSNFAGKVHDNLDDVIQTKDSIIYFGGDAKALSSFELANVCVIDEISYNFKHLNTSNVQIVKLGQVPINYYGMGIFFRQLFETDKDLFDLIRTEHKFQNLTESNKQSSAFRTGLYLTDVCKLENDVVQFHLLRCSSNFTGPSENFCATDHKILDKVNLIAEQNFSQPAKLNHVLAQIYNNSEKGKAKIKSHADKTKDMPRDGIMAFCTFYESSLHRGIKPSERDPFDLCYKNKSVLTSLRFKLKQPQKYTNFPDEFKITLYPNSVFLMPLSTNRIYTHEIKPSLLPFEYLPIRMGYVIRCSKTLANHQDGQTFVCDKSGVFQTLNHPTENDLDGLRKLYYQENTTDECVNYGDVFFSMNAGDYMKPIL
jgi:hypothetical protein